jgi:L-fuconolactonase
MIIDAHQHFWQLSRGDYGWLTPEAGALYRDYLPDDLAPLLKEHGVGATVLVQAAATEAESRFLLRLAGEHAFIAGVVGWVDFEAADVGERVAALATAGAGKLKGLRPMIQDIPDPRWIARPSLDAAFEALVAHELVFDALVRPVHLEALRDRLLRHPRLRAVLDHAGKPDIARGALEPWAAALERLAGDTSICCKLSGLLTEAGTRRSTADLTPWVAQLFRSFGAERMLWGSDWPVLKAAGSYGEWLGLAQELIGRCAPGRAAQVLSGTAHRLYRLH